MIKGEYAKTIQEHDQVNNEKQKNKTKHTLIKEKKKNMFMKRKQEQDKIVKERNKVRKYMHECILQEGSILEVKENVPP